MTGTWEKGWHPTAEQLTLLRKPPADGVPLRGVASFIASEGDIAGEPYELEVGFDDVLIGGRGWAIYLGHAPSEAAKVEKYTSPNPLDNEAFFTEVMKIAKNAADGVREAIAQDWPRRSTKPDKNGCAVHPLFGGVSAEWYCIHCDARSTGRKWQPICGIARMQRDSTRYACACLVERTGSAVVMKCGPAAFEIEFRQATYCALP